MSFSPYVKTYEGPRISEARDKILMLPVGADDIIDTAYLQLPSAPATDAVFRLMLNAAVVTAITIPAGDTSVSVSGLATAIALFDTLWLDLTTAPDAGVTGPIVLILVSASQGDLMLYAPFTVACSDETTALTTGQKIAFRAAEAFNAAAIRASLTTISSSGAVTVDVKKNGTSVFTTKVTIDASEKTSVTATVPSVLTATPFSFVDDDEITIHVDGAGTGATGLKVTFEP